MGRYYYQKKDEADSLKKIDISTLKKWGYIGMYSKSGTITWTHGWSNSKSSISIQSYMWNDDPHIRLIYTQTDLSTDEKTDFDYRISFIVTPCNFGGVRYWFQCPWYRNGVYCGRRVGVLYKGGKYFACRHCYDLSYASKNENRSFSFYPLGKMLDLEKRIAKLDNEITTKYYNGMPTRKYKKLMELERRHYNFDIGTAWQNMEKRLGM